MKYSWIIDGAFLRDASVRIAGDEMQAAQRRADAACENQFMFTHPWDMEYCGEPVTFDGVIDWTYCHEGDPEWAFMLNRQRFMAELGQAYIVTGDERYVQHWKRIFHEWVETNQDAAVHPYTYRRIDTGIRLANWIKGYACIQQSRHWTDADDALFTEQLKEQGAFLYASFRPFDFQSNWGFLEINGMLQAAYFMKEETKNNWVETAISRLEKMIPLQIDRDGMHKEQSPMYHHEVLHSLLEITMTLERDQAYVPDFIEEATSHMLTAYAIIMKPNGHQPMLGDSDDTDIRSTLAVGAVLLDRADLRALAGPSAPLDVLWYFGESGLNTYEAMEQQLPEEASYHLADTGITVFRTGWDKKDHYLLFDHGSMGQVNKGHGHDDTLHIELMSGGREFLIDGGRYTYLETKERAYFKSAHRHNTVTVDGFDASEYAHSWGWKTAAEPIDQKYRFTQEFQFAQAGHTGFWRFESPVHVTRKVIYIPDVYDIVVDCFASTGKHDYTQHFHFPENTPVEWKNEQLTTGFTDDNNVSILPLVAPDDATMKEGFVSRHYTEMEKNPHVEVTYTMREMFAAPFIVLPFTGGKPEATIQQLPVYHINGDKKEDSEVVAYEISLNDKTDMLLCSLKGNDSFLVGDYQLCGELIFIENWKCTDAKVCVIE